MSRLRDSDFPALGTDTPAEQLIGIRFRWYATHARRARIWYRALGTVQLLAALVIAISVAIEAPIWLAPALGGVIALAEGVRTLYGFKDTYPTYTRTAQQLRNEAWLYAQKAGRYARADEPVRLLAERVVEISHSETEDWEAALKSRSI
ncbi:DUF4231 domain-containing protein [Kribbella shirazensis]|uniref:DUF4231 domain-containing protein n=1 Tax=Kribbella shirazensis TaxID=1105143 RepID=A0A7X5VCF1_9ACTN|nr:DUF4231 domain-containing protein [Kribbella shirazensis]NIK57848.1 hypothetical protein [Kribbella shirazensis]